MVSLALEVSCDAIESQDVTHLGAVERSSMLRLISDDTSSRRQTFNQILPESDAEMRVKMLQWQPHVSFKQFFPFSPCPNGLTRSPESFPIIRANGKTRSGNPKTPSSNSSRPRS